MQATSQALSCLVVSFLARVESALNGDSDQSAESEILQQFADIGFLHSWEGLLSTQGKENAMLADALIAIQSMGNVIFRFSSESEHVEGESLESDASVERAEVTETPFDAIEFLCAGKPGPGPNLSSGGSEQYLT